MTDSFRPRVTININAPEDSDGELLTLDLPSDFTIAGLKSSVEAETKLPTHSQQFFHNGHPISGDDKTLEEMDIKDGDVLLVLINRGAVSDHPITQPRHGAQQPNGDDGRRIPTAEEIETIRLRLLNDAGGRARVQEQSPDLISALYDRDRFLEAFLKVVRQDEDRAREREEQLQKLNEDPFDIEAQRKIEEMIRQDNVVSNLQDAIENNPEGC